MCQSVFVLHLGKKNPKNRYHIGNSELLPVESHLDLGVTINSSLTWTEHIINIVKKANSRSFLIKKTFVNGQLSTMSKVFKSYVRPILEFANVIWYPTLKKDEDLIEKVQRRFTRWCYGLERPCYLNRLNEMKLISLKSRQRRGDLINVFKIVKQEKIKFSNKNIFALRQNGRLRGHPLTITKIKFNYDIMKYSFFIRSLDDWNSLPKEIIDVETVNQFKNKIDDYFNF